MTVLLVIHLLVALALIAVVLTQRSAQDGGGLMGGGGTMGGLFTSRGSANLLSRTTAILATIFIAMSLLLGIMASQRHGGGSLSDEIAPVTAPADAAKPDAAVPATDAAKGAAPQPAPAVPEVPVSK